MRRFSKDLLACGLAVSYQGWRSIHFGLSSDWDAMRSYYAGVPLRCLEWASKQFRPTGRDTYLEWISDRFVAGLAPVVGRGWLTLPLFCDAELEFIAMQFEALLNAIGGPRIESSPGRELCLGLDRVCCKFSRRVSYRVRKLLCVPTFYQCDPRTGCYSWSGMFPGEIFDKDGP